MDTSPTEVLTKKDLCKQLKVSMRTIERWMAEGILPPPLRIGPRSPRWRKAEIEKWMDGRREAV